MATLLKPPGTLAQLGNLNGAQLAELAARHAPRVVAGLAVIGIAWQAAQLTWLFLAPAPTTAPAVASAIPPPTTAATVNPQSIADAHLFGTPGAAGGGATDPNNLPQSQISLVLSGTMALEDPEAGFAIVGENTANAKFYRVGAIINGVARLHSVYPERVIIERNGVLETLVLPRGVPSTAPVPAVRNVMTSPNNQVGENLRRIAASNPSALGELLRAQPVFSNGVQKGYRVYPGRDRQQFVRLGLQPGDLVTSVNGSVLDDPNRSTEILNTLTASSAAQITIERNGTTQQLTLDMAQISLPDSNPAEGSVPNSPGSNPRSPTGVPSPQPGSPGAQ